VPFSDNPPCSRPSSPLTGVNGFLTFNASSLTAISSDPASGPFPGCVITSMNIMPFMPPWFCAANWSIRGRRIDRICDLGGSLPPEKPSMRMTAPGGDIALSAASISSGSSGRAAICARVKEADANRKMVEYRIIYADYKSFDGVRMPTRIQRMMDGLATEELTFDKVKVNAKIDASKFAPTKNEKSDK